MNLRKKKILASKALSVGKERIIFLKPRLEEIKEAITKQDIRDLYKEGAIMIKEIVGRRKIIKKKKKRGYGKIHIIVNKRKQEYMNSTRKLRKYVAEMKKQGKISKDTALKTRKMIRNRIFKSKAHLKEQLGIEK